MEVASVSGRRMVSKESPLTLSKAAERPAGGVAEDEAIKDFRRAILQANASELPPRSQTAEELRDCTDLLNPDIGRLRDVAQPGGFRRHHVRQVEPGSVNNFHATTPLMQLLQPDIMLSFLRDLNDEEDPLANDPHAVAPRNASSNVATSIIILKCCFGSAFLIIPHGMKTAGWLGGTVVLIAVYLVMLFGMMRLLDCRRTFPGGARFQDIGAAWGRWGPAYITFGSVLLVTGFNCVWCVTCQQNLGMIVPEWNEVTRLWVFMPPVALLALVRRLKFFTITNLLGIMFCAATSAYLAFYGCQELATNGAKEVIEVNTKNADTLLWVGACGYIFELICQVLPIYDAAADKEMMPKLLVWCTAGVICLYLSFGILFYFAMGEDTAELATLNLPEASFEGKLFPALFSLIGIVTMPLNFFIICQAYEPKFVWSTHYRTRKWMKNAVRLVIVVATYALTWAGGSQLQNFLALVGGVLGANLSMVVPGLLHISICKPRGILLLGDYFMVVAGVLMMILSTYQAAMTWE